jgi:hypothetical protein
MQEHSFLKRKNSLIQVLENLLLAANGQAMSLRNICNFLAGKGYGMLIALFSLPFCLPITIPGTSTPFGLLLAFLGLRVAFAKKLWWPDWILDKQVSYEAFKVVVTKTIIVAKALQKVLRPRLEILVHHPIMHRMHGLLIFALSLLLALPLPIPLTNMLTAIPIFCLGLGLLEDDGVAIIVAYILGIICFLAFGMLFWLGHAGLQKAVSVVS